MSSDLLPIVLVQFAVIVTAGGLFCAIGRRMGIGAFAGAMIAGLLLGPSVLGRLAPDLYRLAFNGGPRALQIEREFEEYKSRQTEERRKLAETGVSEAAIVEFDQSTNKYRDHLKFNLEFREGQYSQARFDLFFIAAIAWMIFAGYGVRLGRLRLYLIDALPPTLLAAALVVVFGMGLLWLLDIAFPKQLERHMLDFDTPTVLAVIIVAVCCALPLGNPAIGRLTQNRTPIDDLPALATATAALLTLLGFGALAVVGFARHRVDVGLPSAQDYALGAAWVVGLTAVMIAAVGPGLRWVFVRFGIVDRNGVWRVAVGSVLVALLSIGLDFAAFWATLAAAMALSWTADTAGEEDQAVTPSDALPLPGILIAVIAFLDFDVWRQVDPLMVVVFLIVLGDGKAIGTMLALRWFGNRSWKDALRFGVAMSAGGPVLVIAVLLIGRGMIGPVGCASLLFAVLILAAVNRPLLGLVGRWMGEPDENAVKRVAE